MLAFATTYMDLEGIILSIIRQRNMISQIGGI